MTFIITLISLLVERFFHWSHLRHWRWFDKYQSWLGRRIGNWPSYALLAICILPLVLLVGFINCGLGGWMYGIPKLIFGVIILLYCIGPNNLWMQVYACINELHKEDPKIAVDRAQSAFGIALPANSQAFHQALTSAIFIEANQRIFAVVFWFVVLGPVGAVLYRSIAICAEKSDLGLISLAAKCQRLLDWIPVRVLTFLFALGGHFMEVFSLWRKYLVKDVGANDSMLTECGVAALDIKENGVLPEDGAAEKATLDLLDRALIIWLVMLAVVAIIVE